VAFIAYQQVRTTYSSEESGNLYYLVPREKCIEEKQKNTTVLSRNLGSMTDPQNKQCHRVIVKLSTKQILTPRLFVLIIGQLLALLMLYTVFTKLRKNCVKVACRRKNCVLVKNSQNC